MDVADQVWLDQIEFVIAFVNEDAIGVKQRTHGAVAKDGTLFEPGYKVFSHDW
jgi:hypothetical protein